MITVNFAPEINQNNAERIIAEIRQDEMGGFFDLPNTYDQALLQDIKKTAAEIKNKSSAVVFIGIGGSYLGHRALIEALDKTSDIEIIYAGNSLSKRELDRAISKVENKDFSIVVISKSGNTLEPKIAFEAFKDKLKQKYGDGEATNSRVYAITDQNKGTLHDEAAANGYKTFPVPDNIGGRYSVLTPVGLLPLAIANVDVDALIEGAKSVKVDEAIKYAKMRYLLGGRGYDTEVFASFEPSTIMINEWLKQLFGESEGKNQQGILPTSVVYSTDLHSLGQFMQDGRRNLFETIIDYPTDELNKKIVQAVQIAHREGGIPVLDIKVDSFDEKGLGELIQFFEIACSVSAKLFGVNPFDQPGVESYKNVLKSIMEEGK